MEEGRESEVGCCVFWETQGLPRRDCVAFGIHTSARAGERGASALLCLLAAPQGHMTLVLWCSPGPWAAIGKAFGNLWAFG